MNTKKAHYEGKLGKYCIELQWSIISSHKLDKKGIILYKIPYTNGYNYYPVQIALYALGNHELYLDRNEEQCLDIFLKHTDWLVNNIVVKEGFGVWEHLFTLPYYNFDRIPWVHGMAQGLALSALLRAYNITNKDVFLETARKAYGVFEVDIKSGGVRFVDKNGNIWLEEYAILPPPHILNGFIFALFGVYEFYLVTGEKNALDLWENGIKTLENNLNKYDLGYWSLYNLVHSHPATNHYHTWHIEQLKVLYRLTDKKVFLEYSDRWQKYFDSTLNHMKASLKRAKVHLKTHGFRNCARLFIKNGKDE